MLTVAWCGWAGAHVASIPHDLAGIEICVDDASIDVRFERGGDVATRAVTERIERYVRVSFDAASLPWSSRSRCDDAVDYLSIVLHVWAADELAPRASAYELAVQVGPRVQGSDGAVRATPPSAFDFRAREVFDERAVGVPAVVFLPRYVEAGLRDLTVRWWQDQLETRTEETGQSVSVARPLALAAALLLVVVCVSRLARLRARAEQPVRHGAEREQRERRRPDQADAEGDGAGDQRQRERQLHHDQRP